MICGKPPFFSEGFGELVHLHLNVAPPSPRSFVPTLPAGAEEVILKMLAKRPEQRFQSMAEVQQALKQLSDGSFVVRGNSTPDFAAGTLPTAILPTPVPGTRQTSTTFSSNGERMPSQPPPAPKSAGLAKPLLGLGIALAVAGGVLLWSRPHGPITAPVVAPPPEKAALPGPLVSPPPPPPAKDPKLVRIEIDTQPGGARVVRISDGADLGVTPWSQDFPAGDGHIEVRLDKEGYEPVKETIALFGDQKKDISLRQKPAIRPKKHPHTSAPPTDEPAKL
jgi:hypothetical protein